MLAASPKGRRAAAILATLGGVTVAVLVMKRPYNVETPYDWYTIEANKVPESGISPEWRAPAKYCYKKGNDWSACAGDHMLYPPTNASKLLERKGPMCLHEPLCWKQLDWRNTDPPSVSCSGLQNSLRFYDWSYHDGVMASLSSLIETTIANVTAKPQDVFLCNTKRAKYAIRNYNRSFQLCPQQSWKNLEGTWETPYSKERSEINFLQLKVTEHARDAHMHIFGFSAAMWENYMSWNRTIILNACHRVDMFRCSKKASAALFDRIRRLASSGPRGSRKDGPFHIIGPGYIHDVEYVRHYSGINSIYLPFSLLEVISASYSGSKPEILYNGNLKPPHELTIQTDFEFVDPTSIRYELEDLAKYRAALVLPYSITNTKSLEQYEMNIPLFVPTQEFAVDLGLFDDRTATYTPYCSERFTDDLHAPAHALAPFEFSPNARGKYGEIGRAHV